MSQSKLLQKLVAHSLKFLLWLMLCSLQDNYKGVIAEARFTPLEATCLIGQIENPPHHRNRSCVLLAGVFVDKKPIPVAEFVEKLLFLTTTDGIDYTDLGDALKRALLSRPTKTTLPKMCPPRCLWAKKKKKTMTTTTGNNDNDADVNKHLVESLFFCFFATCLAEQNSPVSLLRHVLEYLVEVHNTVSATYKNARRANNGPLSELVTKIIYQFALALIEGLVDHRQVIQKGLLQLGGRHFAGMGKVALDWEEYMNTAVNMVNYQGGKNYITSAADAWTQELSVLANYAKLELDNENILWRRPTDPSEPSESSPPLHLRMKRLAFAKNPSVRFPVLVEEVSPVMEKVVVLNENFAAFHQQQPGKAMPSEQWYSEFFGFSNGKHLFAMLVEFVVAKRSQLALAMLEALFRQQEQRREVAIGQEMTASNVMPNRLYLIALMVVELCKFLVEEGIFDEEIMTIVLDERLPTSRFHHSPPHQYYTSRENREEGRARKHRTKSFSSKKGRKLATIEESPLVPVKPELLAVFDADAKMLKQAILDEMKFNEQSPPRKGLIGIQEVEQFLSQATEEFCELLRHNCKKQTYDGGKQKQSADEASSSSSTRGAESSRALFCNGLSAQEETIQQIENL